MNDLEEIYAKMFMNVEITLVKNMTVWQGNQNIVNCYDILRLTNKKLKGLNSRKLDNPKGLTKAKQVLREQLTDEAFVVKQALVIYYQSQDMTEEIELIDLTLSGIKHLMEDTFFLFITNINDQASPLAASLLPYGITQVMLDNLGVDVTNFGKLMKQLKLAMKKQASLLKLITKNITECRIMLRNQLDIAISIYSGTNKEFVKNYTLSRRRLKKPGKHRTYMITISGTVIDSITKAVLYNIKVIAGKKQQLTTTDIKGNYEIKIYKKDADIISFSLSGIYNEKTLDVPKKSIKNGAIMDVELDSIRA